MPHPLDGKMGTGEKLLWQSKSSKKHTIFLVIYITVVILAIYGIFTAIMYNGNNVTCTIDNIEYTGSKCGTVFSKSIFIFLGIIIFEAGQKIFRYKQSYFAITNRKVLVSRSNLFGTIEYFPLGEIKSAFTKKAFFNKLTKTGNIYINVPSQPLIKLGSRKHKRYYKILNVDQHEKVFQIFLQVMKNYQKETGDNLNFVDLNNAYNVVMDKVDDLMG